ncbi:cell cycle histidine kinase CckA [Salinarimonas ramus]|uniref:histidine kinase n=1 Tax=Salinarimonas ramus TaxID=690164 RepID=A0A917V4P5_9HYPH|nr:PAS domain-containing sensor histidine kinase [Salinarimonas ramus]GGK37273.1 signal transduction histidine kinase [Salinarimonas ramus]
MAPTSDKPSRAVERTEKPGKIWLLVVLALVLPAAFFGLSFVTSEQAQPLITALLALLAMAGVFFVTAYAIGALGFTGQGARNDLTKAMADSSSEGLVVVEGDGRVAYANEAYLSFAAATDLAEIKTVERLFVGAPEVSEAIYRLAQAAREERALAEEIRLSPALGSRADYGWYRVRVRPLPRPGAKPAVLWSIADVTHERERHENVFQELQHAIDYLDHAPAGFFSVEPDGSVAYMNATLAAWLDHDLAKVGSGGLALEDMVPFDVATLLASVEGAPGEVRTEIFDIDMVRRAGQALPVRLYHRVAFGIEGERGASRTLVINRSAGEEGSADAQRAAEVRFARFFNNTPIAIATLGREGRILRANAPFVRLFNTMPRAEPGGEEAHLADRILERDREALLGALAAAEQARAAEPVEIGIVGPAERSARIWTSPVNETDGEGEVAIVYALETTEQRQLETQFAQAQKMQAVGQLAGGVAHDFNNVLQAIIGYSDLLLANHRPTDPAFQDIMQIKQNANRAASLVRQLLAFSRRQTLRPEVLDLGDTMSDLTMLLKRLLGERVELDLRHGRDLWPIRADVHQLEQVVINLAVNARDAMPDGGKLTIRTANVPAEEAGRLERPGMPAADYVLIEVADTGTGIPPEVMDKIFEPFFTTKEIGKGTGLGLSTVFGIVKQSNGFVYVDSKPGEGASFKVYLPRHVQTSAEVAAERLETLRRPAADLTGQGVVLLVEDEDPVRAVNSRALKARGYTVLEAASGVEALEAIAEAETPVDIVVSDVVMPEMDGPSLLRELRKTHPDLKVIFVSGYAEDAFKKNLPEGEEFAFLPKPFTLKQLVETVKETMGR